MPAKATLLWAVLVRYVPIIKEYAGQSALHIKGVAVLFSKFVPFS